MSKVSHPRFGRSPCSPSLVAQSSKWTRTPDDLFGVTHELSGPHRRAMRVHDQDTVCFRVRQ